MTYIISEVSLPMAFCGFLLAAIALFVSIAKDDFKGVTYYSALFVFFVILTLILAKKQNERILKANAQKIKVICSKKIPRETIQFLCMTPSFKSDNSQVCNLKCLKVVK